MTWIGVRTPYRMHRLIGMALLSLWTAGASVASDGQFVGQVEVVQADARKMLGALYRSDANTLISYTYPPILAAMGGEPKVREGLEGMFTQLRASGLKLESLKFPRSPDFVACSSNDYVIVHTESVVSATGMKARSVNFQYGIRPKGSKRWTYVEGSRLTTQMLDTFFPDFPSGYEFPKVSRERL